MYNFLIYYMEFFFISRTRSFKLMHRLFAQPFAMPCAATPLCKAFRNGAAEATRRSSRRRYRVPLLRKVLRKALRKDKRKALRNCFMNE